MTNEARSQLYDTTILIGYFRRRAAIKTLAKSPGPDGVLALAKALGKGDHPNASQISQALLQLSAERNADKVTALWMEWVCAPTEPVAAILARLGWPATWAVSAKKAREVLGIGRADSAPQILQAVTAFTSTFKALVLSPDPQGALTLVDILGKGHPNASQISQALLQLSAERDADKITALWMEWVRTPTEPVAAVLAKLGWPASRAVDTKIAKAVLDTAQRGLPRERAAAVASFARVLPVGDETLNDIIYGAWVRSQSTELETLLTEQGRQPGTPALEALHALVTGRLERYAALKDNDGMLVAQAFAIAPEPFRERIASTVAASLDRRLKIAYRRALSGGEIDSARRLDNLKLVGDEDGLFEMAHSLRLAEALDLCKRWAATTGRPAGARQHATVERAVATYRRLGEFKGEPGPKLPEGLVDIFDWWHGQEPSDTELRADLGHPDPFRKARGLFLGHERGLVDAARIAAASNSEHWPERLIARLVDHGLLVEAREDHVMWVSACAGDEAQLNASIGGTPEDYARNTDRLGNARGSAAVRTKALLEILCVFQSASVASGITVDDSAEATERHAVEIEDAPQMDF